MSQAELLTRSPTSAQMRIALQHYIDAINARDTDAVVALYADGATIEDPVGSPAIQGREAIAAFYAKVVPLGLKLRMVAPARGSHGNAAAMAFEVDAPAAGGGRSIVRVIDVMTFDAEGKFTSMRAFWAPDDMAAG
jgi:steroid delta-isomerase